MSLQDLWFLLTKKHKTMSLRNNEDTKETLEQRKAVELAERQNQAELHKLQIQELKRLQAKKGFEDLKESFFSDEEDEEEDGKDIMGLFGTILNKVNPQPQPVNVTSQPSRNTPTSSIKDEDIRAFLAKQKRKHLVIAKSMPKEIIKRKAMNEQHLTEDEAERAYIMLMNEF